MTRQEWNAIKEYIDAKIIVALGDETRAHNEDFHDRTLSPREANEQDVNQNELDEAERVLNELATD